MKSSTILFMFELEHCINDVCISNYVRTYVVNEKFKQFVTYLRQIVSPIDSTLQIFCAKFMIKIQIECELIA